MSEVRQLYRQLYKSRWNELATLRTNIALAHDLTAAEKQNIDQALRSDQEAITEARKNTICSTERSPLGIPPNKALQLTAR